ncbi:arginase family protein [Klosneuvirus KNV1]|uniref:Arginase family protein n=1 Tax=Klosneuvirus KNV1 TaxID=1977640 RepID=A0A1V0SJM8_9VIRU|nr:arginase family protein [Klosneuvirus KNV1]
MLPIYVYNSAAGQLKDGVQDGPAEIVAKLREKKYQLEIIEPNEIRGPRKPNKLNYDVVSEDCQRLYQSIIKHNHEKPLFLGGDHSMAIGTIISILAKHPDLFVIWIDAHCDINTSETTLSNNIHGMPVAQICGLENKYKFDWIKKNLDLSRFIYVGIRDIDKAEATIVTENKIKYITVSRLQEDGIKEIVHGIKKLVDNAPIHISLDVDGIDPKYIPSTGTSVEKGLELDDVIYLIKNLNNVKSMDIAEFNPSIGLEVDKQKSLDSIMKIIEAYKN